MVGVDKCKYLLSCVLLTCTLNEVHSSVKKERRKKWTTLHILLERIIALRFDPQKPLTREEKLSQEW